MSVWRELRRPRNQELADKVSPVFGELHRAAHAGDWQGYLILQGGPFVSRSRLVLRAWYQYRNEPTSYGEYQKAIKGLVMPASSIPPVETCPHSYRIVKMEPKSSYRVDPGFDLQGASAPSWSSVNNCTERFVAHEKLPSKLVAPTSNTVSEEAMYNGNIDPDIQITELPLNLDELRRLSRQQRQELTNRLKKYDRENSDEAFLRTARAMCTFVGDENSWIWRPEIVAAKKSDLTSDADDYRWRDQLKIEEKLRGKNYLNAAREYELLKTQANLCCQGESLLKNHGNKQVNIDDVTTQLKHKRVFLEGYIVKSISYGAKLHVNGSILEVREGILCDAGGRNSHTVSEYVMVWRLISRWKRVVK